MKNHTTKHLREKTFAVFAVICPTVNVRITRSCYSECFPVNGHFLFQPQKLAYLCNKGIIALRWCYCKKGYNGNVVDQIPRNVVELEKFSELVISRTISCMSVPHDRY